MIKYGTMNSAELLRNCIMLLTCHIYRQYLLVQMMYALLHSEQPLILIIRLDIASMES